MLTRGRKIRSESQKRRRNARRKNPELFALYHIKRARRLRKRLSKQWAWCQYLIWAKFNRWDLWHEHMPVYSISFPLFVFEPYEMRERKGVNFDRPLKPIRIDLEKIYQGRRKVKEIRIGNRLPRKKGRRGA